MALLKPYDIVHFARHLCFVYTAVVNTEKNDAKLSLLVFLSKKVEFVGPSVQS